MHNFIILSLSGKCQCLLKNNSVQWLSFYVKSYLAMGGGSSREAVLVFYMTLAIFLYQNLSRFKSHRSLLNWQKKKMYKK